MTKISTSSTKFLGSIILFLMSFFVWGQTDYTLIKNVSELEVGAKYIIVGKRSNGSMFVLNTQATNNRIATALTTEVSDETITLSSNFREITLDGSTGLWTFQDLSESSGFLYAASSSQNYLRTQTTNNANGQWSITIDGTTGLAAIIAQGTNTRKVLQMNTSSAIISCYSSASQAPVYLYKKVVGNPPTGVVTGTTNNITATSAEFIDNNVGGDGGSTITQRGVVFATTTNPTIADTKVIVAGTTGSFTALITGLANSTQYFVRAFAINGAGTTYGDNVSFTTNAPAGSSSSDVIENSSFSYPENISYLAFQGTTLTTGNSIEVAQFTIRDGGASADADALATTLTAIGFNVTNHANLRKIGLFDGTTLVSEVNPAATVSFSGLSLTANDNSTKTFSLRVSFQTSVTDNAQFTFTVNSVSPEAGKSLFASANGGGATTSTAVNDNTIEVTASALNFEVQPSNVNISAVMSPAVQVSAKDANGNLDLDSISILISSTGSLTGTTTVNTDNGVAVFSNLVHTAAANARILTASSGALEVDSNSFNVVTAPWEDFETGTKGSYAAADVTLVSGSWNLSDALLGTDGNDRKNGAKSLRLRANGVATMNFNKSGGLGTVSVLHAKYGTNINGSWRLEASDNNGASWDYVSPTYSTTTTTLTNQDVPVNMGGNVRFRIIHVTGDRLNFDDIYVTDYTATPEPEINVVGNSQSIANNSVVASTANHTDFENVEVSSGSLERTFTIENLGNADLIVTSINSSSADFIVNTTATNFTVAEASSTTFTVTFDPTALGTRTGTITILSDDSDESIYTFAVQGEGTNAAASDLVIDSDFSYASNIPYQNFQATTINAVADGRSILRLKLRDGGADANDADALGTTLNSVTFSVSNFSFIRTAALFSGSDLISNTPTFNNGNNTITFSGLTGALVTAADNAEKLITVYVAFKENVTDNEQIQFTVTSATAASSGSVFSSGNAGGAFSSISSDINRLEVTADRLAFTTQPTGQNVGLNLNQFTVSGTDALGNIDLDYSSPNQITLTTSGTNMTSGSPYVFNNGSINISDVSFGTAQNDITLIATTTGLTASNTATSNSFTISTVANNSYRTIGAGGGTWSTANWERFVSGSWGASSAPTTNTANSVYIRHEITSGGSISPENIVVENGGKLTFTSSSTIGTSLVVNDGGVFQANAATTINGDLIVNSGGKVVINSTSISGVSAFWNGTENFKSGSILEIQNWNFGASSGDNRVIQNPSIISSNDAGYYFGNLTINATLSAIFVMSEGSQTINLTENDFTVNVSGNNVALTNAGSNVTIGGDVIINNGQLSVASTTNGNPITTILGDITINAGIFNLNQNSSGSATSDVLLAGNLSIETGGDIRSNDAGCNLKFNKNGEQTASFGGSMGTNVNFEILSGSTTKLIDFDMNMTNSSNKLTVFTGGTLDFNYRNILGLGAFEQQSGATLKITDADGILTSGATGNVRNTGTRTFNQTGNFHFTGNVTPQNTGNVMSSGSTSKQIQIDKDNATDVVNLSQTTGTSNQLYIKKGIFNESVSAFVTGSGNLQMDSGSAYRMYVLNTTLPQIDGTYTINDGASVELLGSGNQVLRGGRAYYDLIFGNGGTKTITSAISTIGGGVLIDENTILDVETRTFGGSNTLLFMDANSRFINGGSSTRPSIGGDYLLDETSTIEFTGTSNTTIRTSGKTYANVEISGTSVTLSSNLTSMDFLPNATFTVKNGGVFDVKNNNGLSGANNTAIRNTNNPTVVLETGSTVEYIHTEAQTVTNEVPYSTLVLKGNGLKTFVDNTEVNANLLVSETASALVPATKTLTVLGDIVKSNTEDFTIANNAFLMQSDAQTVNNNAGNLKVQRATSLIRRGDVTIWSAPVANQNLLAFSPETLTNRFYTHDETTNAFVNITPGSNVFEAGRGYGIRARNTLLSTDPMENWLGTFAGVPNNGSYSFPITKAPNPTPDPDAYDPTGFNMVGNPYPSALNLLDFYNENSAIIENKFYLYEHTLPSNTPSGDLSKTNYGVLTVGTPSIYAPATQTDLSNPSDINPYSPVIQPGQGFFVRATANGNLNFLNTMRSNTSGSFFRANNVASNGLDMFRLKLTAPDNFSNQTVIGFFETTTNELDAIDTKGFSSSPLYSILGNNKLVIQARSYPLEQSTIIPIGFYAGVAGTHTLALHQPEGVFVENQYVLLHDLLLGVYHNLSISPYTFDVATGANNNRFEVLFSEVLSNENPDFENNQLLAFSNENVINIQLKGQSLMQKVKLYDLSGRLIYTNNDIQAESLQIKNLNTTNTVLLVQVTNEAGQVLTTKLFY